MTDIKYDLNDEDLQNIAEHIEKVMDEIYKDEIQGVPVHIKKTLCQNYAIECKKNNIDIDAFLDNYECCKNGCHT